jgi:hypothetical protein
MLSDILLMLSQRKMTFIALWVGAELHISFEESMLNRISMELDFSTNTTYDDIKEIYIEIVLLGPAYAVFYKSLHHLFILHLMKTIKPEICVKYGRDKLWL